MKKFGVTTALLACLAVLGGIAPALGKKPPEHLKKVGDHWTAWDPPEAGPDAYIIVRGDTLWDLAGRWFGDPFLWPQIWDENRYILDSHWIYPGDPLVVPGRPTVVPDEGELPVADTGPGDAENDVAVVPARPALVPVADPADLYCSGHIVRDPAPTDVWISGRDHEGYAIGEGHVVFLNHGRDHGIRAGDAFAVTRRASDVRHPETRRTLGTMVRRLGKLRVMMAHATSSTAVIEMSCEELQEGDEVAPWETIPVPMLESLPVFDRWDPTPSGGAVGSIVAVKDDLTAFAAGHVIFTDLGRGEGIGPGDSLTLYRDRAGDGPRVKIGQAVVLTAGQETSSAKITYTVKESMIGDRVEVIR